MDVKTAEILAVEKLSPREKEIAEAIHRGIPRRDIAESLGISSGTLQNYVAAIFAKLDVSSAPQMVLVIERARTVKA